MAKNRYMNDYRLEERTGPGGRVVREYAYVGETFRYVLGTEDFRKARIRGLVLCLIGWLAFLLALLPRSAGSRTVYVALPFVFSALPLGIVTGTLLSAPKGEEGLERRQADRLSNRYPAASVFIVILCAASLIGEAVLGLSGAGYEPGDAVFSLCAALLAVCGALLLKKRRSFDTRKS